MGYFKTEQYALPGGKVVELKEVSARVWRETKKLIDSESPEDADAYIVSKSSDIGLTVEQLLDEMPERLLSDMSNRVLIISGIYKELEANGGSGKKPSLETDDDSSSSN